MNGPTQAGDWRSRVRWWWFAAPVAIAAFALAYGITKLAGDDGSTVTQTVPAPGISFGEAHAVPLHISQAQFERRVQVPPIRVRQRNTHPPETCRYYRLSDQAGRYIFCFANGELVLAYGGANAR